MQTQFSQILYQLCNKDGLPSNSQQDIPHFHLRFHQHIFFSPDLHQYYNKNHLNNLSDYGSVSEALKELIQQ